MTQAKTNWDAGLYDSVHHYVANLGRGLVDVLAPQQGERILDLGCGTGHLTNEIAERGAEVLGIDSSPDMIAQARQNYPKLRFQLTDAIRFESDAPFDAVFSNAVLHWIQPAEEAAATMRKALRTGGRLVVEFGGKNNVAAVTAAAGVNLWYFPGIAEYATLLERSGFEVISAVLFPRPTPLEGEDGLREWVAMFYKGALPEDTVRQMEQELRPKLYRDGTWYLDYRRLRRTAIAI